jgi:hypothetical protein
MEEVRRAGSGVWPLCGRRAMAAAAQAWLAWVYAICSDAA